MSQVKIAQCNLCHLLTVASQRIQLFTGRAECELFITDQITRASRYILPWGRRSTVLRYFVVTQTKLFLTFNIGTNITVNFFEDEKGMGTKRVYPLSIYWWLLIKTIRSASYPSYQAMLDLPCISSQNSDCQKVWKCAKSNLHFSFEELTHSWKDSGSKLSLKKREMNNVLTALKKGLGFQIDIGRRNTGSCLYGKS